MLNKLQIRNFVIFEDLDLDFQDGFTVFSGETGAGKSLIIGALKLLLVKRLNNSVARDDQSPTLITATFNIEQLKPLEELLKGNFIFCDDNLLILKRIIDKDGKSKAFINNEAVTISFLNEVAGFLLEIHGQHETHNLFDVSKHIDFVDQLIADKQLLPNLEQQFKKWRDLQKRLRDIRESREKIQEEIEYLELLVSELGKLNLSYSYFEELLIRKDQLKKSKELGQLIFSIKNGYDGSGAITDQILSLQKTIINNLDKDEEALGKILSLIEEQLSLSDKILAECNLDEFDANEYEHIEEQISEYKRLARKYNCSLEELEPKFEESEQRLLLLKKSVDNEEGLEREVTENRAEYIKLASSLDEERKSVITLLESDVKAYLKDLYMERTEFQIAAQELEENNWHKKGIKNYLFKVKTNPGQPFGELSKIASGGELSRFMLSLKLALKTDHKTLIFDEIDSGISGKVSEAVGFMLKDLSKENQVFIITHQPQVAAKSSSHLSVIKSFDENATSARVIKLSEDEKLEEIARMISGTQVTEEARIAASKLVA